MAAPPGAPGGTGRRPDPVAKPGSRPPRRRSPGRGSRRGRVPLALPRLGDPVRLLGGPARILRRAPRRLGKTNRLDPYPPGRTGEVERTRATPHAPTLVSGAAAPVRTRHHLQGKHRVKHVPATSRKTRSPTARTGGASADPPRRSLFGPATRARAEQHEAVGVPSRSAAFGTRDRGVTGASVPRVSGTEWITPRPLRLRPGRSSRLGSALAPPAAGKPHARGQAGDRRSLPESPRSDPAPRAGRSYSRPRPTPLARRAEPGHGSSPASASQVASSPTSTYVGRTSAFRRATPSRA
jgi:hypothetical protein